MCVFKVAKMDAAAAAALLRADSVVDAPLGGLARPTPIADAVTGAVIRA
jgi:hypothetical protein